MPEPHRTAKRPLPDSRELLAAYLPGEAFAPFATRILGKAEAETPAEIARLNYRIREEGNARTARQSAEQAAQEFDLAPEEVTRQGEDWLGL